MAAPFTDEVDEFGNPIPPWMRQQPPMPTQGLPFDPGVTAIPARIPDPATSGVNGIIGGAPPSQGPPGAEPNAGPGAGPNTGLPPWLQAPINAANDMAQTPPWAQGEMMRRQQSMEAHKGPPPEVDAISGGGLPPGRPEAQRPVSGISRDPSLAERENQNIMQLGGLREQRENRKSGIMDMSVLGQQSMLNENEARRQQREQAIAAKREQLTADVDKYASGDIDPERWSKRQGIGSALLYGVTAFLSGMANPRGPNTMVEWIGKQIDRDLESQRADMMRRGNALSMKNNMLAQEVEQAGSLAAGEEAYRAKQWALAGQKIAAVDQSFASQEQRVLTQQAMVEADKARRMAEAQYGLELGKLGMAQDKQIFDQTYDVAKLQQQEAESRRSAGVQMRGQDISSNTNDKDREAMLKAKEMEARRLQIEGDREAGVANPATGKNVGRFTLGDKTEWVKAREAGQEYHRGKAAYEEYISLVKKGVKTPLNDEERRRAKSAYAEVVTNWKQAKQMGAWDKGLQTLGEQAIPPPIEIGGKSVWDIPGQLIGSAIAEPTLALEDNARRLGPEIDAKFNVLGYESIDGRPFSDTFSPKKMDATEGEGPAARASKTYPEGKGPYQPHEITPLETPKIGK